MPKTNLKSLIYPTMPYRKCSQNLTPEYKAGTHLTHW